MESDDDDLSFLSLVKQHQSSSHHHQHHHPKATCNDTIFTIPSDDEDDIATLRASQSLVGGIGGGNEDDDHTSMTMDKLHETQEVWSPLTAATTASPSLTTTTTTPHDAPSRSSRVRTTSGNHHHDDDGGSQRLELSKVVERRRSRVDQPTSARPLSHRTKHTTNTSVLESTVTATMTAMTQETTTRVLSSATTTTTIMGSTPIPPNSTTTTTTTTTTAPSSTGTNNITEPTPSTQTATNTARPSHTGSSSAQKENVTESPNNRNQSDDQATTKRRKTTEKNPQPKPSSAATTSDTKTSTTTTKSRPTAPTKKLTFQDQVLVLMLNALKPFTLKLLSEELKTSETSVNFVLLSLVDKGLVVTKDFAAGKNGRVKTLYWANQDHHVRTKKTKDHLRSEPASATERDAARTKMMELQNEIATVRNQWQQVLLTPSNDDLTRLVTTETAAYQECVRARDLVRERIAAAGGPRTKMRGVVQEPRIHQYYRDEWIQRKRKCMDFVEQLADALEKKPREIIQLCDIDTDEMNQVVLPAKKYPM